MRTVLFVCTGNTCRSPMAEAIARHHIDAGILGPGADIFVASAGIQAGDAVPTSLEAVGALADLGIEYDGRSKPLTGQMIRKADFVLCMTEAQQTAARALVGNEPDQAAKIMRIDPDNDIEDPVGMGQPAYDSLAQRLHLLIPKRLKELLSGKPPKAVKPSRRQV